MTEYSTSLRRVQCAGFGLTCVTSSTRLHSHTLSPLSQQYSPRSLPHSPLIHSVSHHSSPNTTTNSVQPPHYITPPIPTTSGAPLRGGDGEGAGWWRWGEGAGGVRYVIREYHTPRAREAKKSPGETPEHLWMIIPTWVSFDYFSGNSSI